jgi:superfamily II DNA or RNA helicase
MGLRELKLSPSYETTESKSQLLDDFYIPVLENACKYYRIAGFFSSSALSVAAKGIEGLVNNGGKMYLLISPEISEEDYKIIKEHGLNADSSVFSELSFEITQDENLKALAWLLDNRKLEIKIVVGKKSRNSLFHQKIGIIFDNAGDMISFSGSINETAQAWISNIEEFKVFCSWEPGQLDYLQSDLTKFLAYWKDQRPDIADVYDIPESIKAQIVKVKPRDIWDLNIMRRYRKDKKISENKLSLFPHQERAVYAWKTNGYSLLMEMATGTGKTRTAIGCLLDKLNDSETLLTIVATPQNTLSRQWREDLIRLNITLDREGIIDGSNSKWKKDLELILLDLSDKKIKAAIIFTTHDTASSERFVNIIRKNKYNTKILFIGDEVHATGAAKQRNALLPEYDYRIGLSATPERMFDEGGTSFIREYFGNKSFEFTIADALKTINPLTGKPFLNTFSYHPIFVRLTESESKKYGKISQLIAILKAKDNYDPDELQRLYDRRAEIGKNAENKFEALANLLDSMLPETIQDTILFVSDKQIQRGFDILSSRKIKRAKITESESASKVVNDEGDTERQEIIAQFVRRQLQVLVGIKCLDEGIDIPNARVAILMASSTNPREFVQRVGRVIRQAPDKQPSEIYDFIAVPYEGDAGTGLLEKEARRAAHIAANAINYDEVKALFLENGVDLDANQ